MRTKYLVFAILVFALILSACDTPTVPVIATATVTTSDEPVPTITFVISTSNEGVSISYLTKNNPVAPPYKYKLILDDQPPIEGYILKNSITSLPWSVGTNYYLYIDGELLSSGEIGNIPSPSILTKIITQ